MNQKVDVLIVGAGLAGLACAIRCKHLGKDFLLIEESKRVGGRIGSVRKDGYIFDLGFQVYNTAYTYTNSFLNIDKIKLRTFKPGASIHNDNLFNIISDPLRDFRQVFSTLFSKLATLSDKIKIMELKRSLINYTIEKDHSIDLPTMSYLRNYGFSEKIIEIFFWPFLSGIFLERNLETSAKFFKYVFSKFNIGLAALPSEGMQEIPDNMVNQLESSSILLGKKVQKIHSNNIVKLNDGQSIIGNRIILTGESCGLMASKVIRYNSIKTIYFSSKIKPRNGKYIHLFPYDKFINNIAFLTSISKEYSSNSDHLISISVFSENNSEKEIIKYVNKKLTKYYGGARKDYQFLKYLNIKKATISQPYGYFKNLNFEKDGIIFAGDHTINGSIEGAVLSGIIASKALKF